MNKDSLYILDAGIYMETQPMVPPHHNVKINIPTANPLFVVGILGIATVLLMRRRERP
ncbi:VPXXXP-CTERM sorting domain-containing protein [Methanohalophilus mahii]|uniref:VPXXXP-CTERM sorting domain-containing protein n=1 Tax=Methanohalophilus mahii TaxID=2176 RepID=UPI000A04381D